MGVCEYGPDVWFVHQGNAFFRLAECRAGEYSEDIKVSFCDSVYVIYKTSFYFVLLDEFKLSLSCVFL